LKANIQSLIAIALLAIAPVLAEGGEKKAVRVNDVIYGRKDGMSLTMDVFYPEGKPNGAAVVLLASGGFKSSASEIRPIFNTEFLKRGYTCFVVVHGSQPRYTVPEIRDDVNRAVRYIRYNAKKYEIDPNRIGMGGISSGGLLTLLVGTGKTLMGMATVHAHAGDRPYRALVFCPGQLVNKWEREIQATLPGVTVIQLETWKDLLHLDRTSKAAGAEWYIIARDRRILIIPLPEIRRQRLWGSASDQKKYPRNANRFAARRASVAINLSAEPYLQKRVRRHTTD
jgi:alpha/beta hydrolase fold